MGSWAAVAKAEPQGRDPGSTTVSQALFNSSSVAVVDANAIIAGLPADIDAERVVTVEEVLAEVRDRRARDSLASLPFDISVMEPSESAVAAVLAFAKATGEIAALSRADVRLIALAYTLETSLNGEDHIARAPAPPRVHARRSATSKRLPGWDVKGGDWAELDRLAELEMAPAPRAAGEVPSGPAVSQAAASEDAGSSDQGEWEVAACSASAARRRRRREARHAARAAQAAPVSGPVTRPAAHPETALAAEANTASLPPEAAVDYFAGEAGGASDWREEEDEGGGAAGDYSPVRFWAGLGDSSGSDTDASSTASGSGKDGLDGQGEASPGNKPESSVACITADFAMQNVLLQMGLLLVSPTGQAVRELRRWALRCTACSRLCRDPARMFCEHCGHAALRRVEVCVTPDGVEQYGVPKRHNIRGTRFSLPKPKGGKRNKDPILSEDVMHQRMPHLRKPKIEAPDPFAPEYGQDSWLQRQEPRNATLNLLGLNRKANPNERRHVRTNRRK